MDLNKAHLNIQTILTYQRIKCHQSTTGCWRVQIHKFIKFKSKLCANWSIEKGSLGIFVNTGPVSTFTKGKMEYFFWILGQDLYLEEGSLDIFVNRCSQCPVSGFTRGIIGNFCEYWPGWYIYMRHQWVFLGMLNQCIYKMAQWKVISKFTLSG